MALTLKEIKDAKPREKLYKLNDGYGLYLAILPSGKKVWRYDYVDSLKKRKTKTIGDNEDVHRDEARRLVLEYKGKLKSGFGIDDKLDQRKTFKYVFEIFLSRWKETVSEKHYTKVVNGINKNCMRVLANMDVADIKARHIIDALSPFEERGALENLRTVKNGLNQVFDIAVARDLCEYNPARAVTPKVFQKHTSKPQRHLTLDNAYKLNLFFDNKSNNYSLRACAKFTFLTMVRAINSSRAKWDQIDFKNKVWVIPDATMKMKNRPDHIVPLSRQALEVLESMRPLSGEMEYIFPNAYFTKPLNYENIRIALTRLDIDTTVHGFRHLASTFLHETQKFSKAIVDKALAHADKDQISAAYNHAKYIESRRIAMQKLADFMDKCTSKESNILALEDEGIIIYNQ